MVAILYPSWPLCGIFLPYLAPLLTGPFYVVAETFPLVLLPRSPHFFTMAFTLVRHTPCYRLQDLFRLHIRLYAGIVDRYIDPTIDWSHGFQHAIAIGLDDWARLSSVGPRQPPYDLLITYIGDLRRRIPELFDIYHLSHQFSGVRPYGGIQR